MYLNWDDFLLSRVTVFTLGCFYLNWDDSI